MQSARLGDDVPSLFLTAGDAAVLVELGTQRPASAAVVGPTGPVATGSKLIPAMYVYL